MVMASASMAKKQARLIVVFSFTLPLYIERFCVLGGKTFAIKERAFRILSVPKSMQSRLCCESVTCLLMCDAKLHEYESSVFILMAF